MKKHTNLSKKWYSYYKVFLNNKYIFLINKYIFQTSAILILVRIINLEENLVTSILVKFKYINSHRLR